MPIDTAMPTRQTLDDTPGRVLAFLRGAGTNKVIRSLLQANGYTPAEHALGWTLLHKVSGFAAQEKAALNEGVDPAVQNAINTLDAWDEPNFARISATLQRLHPKQEAFLFENLKPATGPASVLTVSTLLSRLDALQSGKDRKATHKEDLAALQTLVGRGYTEAERKRLRGLVEQAQAGTEAAGPVDVNGEAEKQHEADLMQLRLWHLDWAQTARSVITRRDHLIRLGLAKRRTKKKEKPAEPGVGTQE